MIQFVKGIKMTEYIINFEKVGVGVKSGAGYMFLTESLRDAEESAQSRAGALADYWQSSCRWEIHQDDMSCSKRTPLLVSSGSVVVVVSGK